MLPINIVGPDQSLTGPVRRCLFYPVLVVDVVSPTITCVALYIIAKIVQYLQIGFVLTWDWTTQSRREIGPIFTTFLPCVSRGLRGRILYLSLLGVPQIGAISDFTGSILLQQPTQLRSQLTDAI